MERRSIRCMTLLVDRLLLLQMKKQFDEHIIDEGFFGQEINMTNYNWLDEYVLAQYKL